MMPAASRYPAAVPPLYQTLSSTPLRNAISAVNARIKAAEPSRRVDWAPLGRLRDMVTTATEAAITSGKVSAAA
jgi:hypothetical protein